MNQIDSTDFMDDRTIKLRTQPRNGANAQYVRITPNRYNRVNMSFRLTSGDYINADLTMDEWLELLQQIRRFANVNQEDYITTELLKSNQPYGYITIGRDAEGVIYIELGNRDKGKEKFEFLPLHMFRKVKDGQPASPALFSPARALGWADYVGRIIADQWRFGYKPDEKKGAPRGQGGQGGYQQRQQHNGGQGGYANNNAGYQQRQYPNNSVPEVTGSLDDIIM